MKIKESIKINSSATAIWSILQDPGNMPSWNPKCISCNGSKSIKKGSSFDAVFKLGKNPKSTTCKIMELKPCEQITIRYSGEAFSSEDGFVDETFYLNSIEPMQTKIRLEVDFSNSKLPVFIKIIMWFINTFGYKAGKSSLDGIQDLLK